MISSLERYMTQQDDNQRLGMPADESVGDRAEVDRATTKKLLTPDELDSDDAANPPRTTSNWFTAPKFGSAGSGGAEIEPGSEKD
jgi:hypothetical protein